MPLIPNFFTYAGFYSEAAKSAPPGSTLVEVGVFCGKSLLHLANEVKKKGCKVIGVDWGKGSPEFCEHGDDTATYWKEPGKMAGELVKWVTSCEVEIPLIICGSVRGAEFFGDGSLWFVFIDADHSYEAVKKDIAAWWPKVQSGGRLAGHDYETQRYPGVRQAVDEFAAEKGLTCRVVECCWEVVKP